MTAAQRSDLALFGGVLFLVAGAALFLYAIWMAATMPNDDIVRLFRGLVVIVALPVATCLLGWSWALLLRKSEARSARRCPRCQTIFEPGPNDTLIPTG